MTELKQKSKKISRRDAIKLLGAVTGATILANLPSKWKTPEIAQGVLPAHAQSSALIHTLACSTNQLVSQPNSDSYASSVTINPTTLGIVMRWTITLNNVTLDNGADPLTGTALTNGSGVASINTPSVTITNPTLSASVSVTWSFENASDGTGSCNQVFTYPVLPIVTTDSIFDQDLANSLMDFSGTVTNDGGSPVTARGFVWSTSPNPTLPTNDVPSGSGTGAFNSTGVNVSSSGTIYLRAYATNSVGTAYGGELNANNQICLAAGTLVSMADGSTKPIEEITYNDELLVWNFDEGHFDTAKPLWIKKTETTHRFNRLEFSDGSYLETINQHRIFNKELGKFTYPMTEDTPIGTTTFNVDGEEVKLVNKYIVQEEVDYYNLITFRHMNLFGNGILTSVGYNNMYPIVDMKFVKDNRALTPKEKYGDMEDRFYEGLRLAEQDIPIADTLNYIRIRKGLEAKFEPMASI